MKTKNFTFTLQTTQSPQKVFKAMQDVRNWWSGYYSEKITGSTINLNDEFSFEAGDGLHSTKHKLIEVVPDKKVVWLTTYCKLDFIEHKDEWTGTKIIFEITTKGNSTELKFTHEGLTPTVECYNACAPAWTQYLENKLKPLIETIQ